MISAFIRFDSEIYETDDSSVAVKHAYLVPYSRWDSKGGRALPNMSSYDK